LKDDDDGDEFTLLVRLRTHLYNASNTPLKSSS